MFEVAVEIIRYADDSQPGWVECRLRDAFEKEWFFVEKVPVVSMEYLDRASSYPKPGTIACQVVSRRELDDGRELVLIDTQHPWGVSSTTGEDRFEVEAGQILETGP